MAIESLLAGKSDPQANASYESGTAPTAGGVAVFADGDTDIDANLGWSGTDLLGIEIPETFGGNIGGASSYLETVVNQTGTGYVKVYGRGKRFNFSGGGAANVIYEIQFRPSNGGKLNLISCTNNDLSLERGTSEIATTVILVNVVAGGDHYGIIRSHASDLVTLLEVNDNARILMERDFTTARVAGRGTLTTDLIAPSGVAGGTVELRSGIYAPVRGSIGTFTGYAGVIDATGLKKSVTFSAGTIYPGVEIRRKRTGPALDYSACTLKYGGPKITYVD
jgi:hypothetical protein